MPNGLPTTQQKQLQHSCSLPLTCCISSVFKLPSSSTSTTAATAHTTKPLSCILHPAQQSCSLTCCTSLLFKLPRTKTILQPDPHLLHIVCLQTSQQLNQRSSRALSQEGLALQ
jgi:hypothetical protein